MHWLEPKEPVKEIKAHLQPVRKAGSTPMMAVVGLWASEPHSGCSRNLGKPKRQGGACLANHVSSVTCCILSYLIMSYLNIIYTVSIHTYMKTLYIFIHHHLINVGSRLVSCDSIVRQFPWIIEYLLQFEKKSIARSFFQIQFFQDELYHPLYTFLWVKLVHLL